MDSCCAPARDPENPDPAAGDGADAWGFAVPKREPAKVRRGMVRVDVGEFDMGGEDVDANPTDGEGPPRPVRLSPFHIDTVCVTNVEYARFVRETGFVTDAEREGWSYVFHLLVAPTARGHVMDASVPGAPWWLAVRGASWRAPHGPGSSMSSVQNHPVTHVSWRDAAAYAAWAGKRLPTEAQWEAAARGGLSGARYPWGDELLVRGAHRCNIWQGSFPRHNTAEDGHLGTAPVKTFRPNGYGLYQMAGNVWEWCADWWTTARDGDSDPTGPATGTSKVIRGGSYLCHDSYCNRYRVAARTHNTPDSSTGHMGFRCVF
nr:formylglycine-generating enzyme family protein [Stackebrandtia nassauensis]